MRRKCLHTINLSDSFQSFAFYWWCASRLPISVDGLVLQNGHEHALCGRFYMLWERHQFHRTQQARKGNVTCGPNGRGVGFCFSIFGRLVREHPMCMWDGIKTFQFIVRMAVPSHRICLRCRVPHTCSPYSDMVSLIHMPALYGCGTCLLYMKARYGCRI